ncbi:hypothetical protein NIES2135_34240 [Leptolyngbya boryana NIES-2135]|uniref:Uncharacterized protein n=1 Tax=Leptolyngbya boryana NIES-2135 TaxID=1973484 RepID=A0A1Z4JIN4_LEPBY|nr:MULTISPECIES: hypothetical protein [Leptolyngbya]BAY56590.1 hypothetical protein NIES2135_34240 [Leptolyngbya boryana NIES-2135]MBD2369892.1 hypothetical protein [Leptolyngbya sp. FACHB-161]MBD2376163.1 hypothetical protein [Leptolyngbya sp. FACHB-238]MBD2400438.1 hypothetical protein [Leptolyngbya sp. FACHB-239]MBD2406980.1 hypothetical protein [Leptolyngbya sp. FACHB-402]
MIVFSEKQKKALLDAVKKYQSLKRDRLKSQSEQSNFQIRTESETEAQLESDRASSAETSEENL